MVKLLLRFNADPNICDKVSIYREYKRILHVTRFRSSIYWIYNVMYVGIRSFYINLLFQYFVIKIIYDRYYLSVGVACYNCRHPWKNSCIHISMSCHLCQHVLMWEWYCQHYTIHLYYYYKTTKTKF